MSLWGLLTEASPAGAARAVLITCGGIHGDLAMGVYVIKCQFQYNRTRRYIRLHMS